jgi:hypothetical protein
MPSAVRSALQALAKQRDTTVTDVVLEQVKQFEQFASLRGQEAYERILAAVTESTVIYKGPPPSTDHIQPTAWEWHGLNVWHWGIEAYQSGQAPCFMHTVKHREGQNRSDAVRTYAELVWKEWALMQSEQEQNDLLEEVGDVSKHLFVIGYVSFGKWKVFPSQYEASLHRDWFVFGKSSNPKHVNSVAEPESAQDAAFFTNAAKHLLKLWQGSVANEQGRVVLQDLGDTLPIYNEDALKLAFYPQVTLEDNIRTWVGQLLKMWKQVGGDAAELIHNTTLVVDVLTIEDKA